MFKSVKFDLVWCGNLFIGRSLLCFAVLFLDGLLMKQSWNIPKLLLEKE